jgi:hypothetical protein
MNLNDPSSTEITPASNLAALTIGQALVYIEQPDNPIILPQPPLYSTDSGIHPVARPTPEEVFTQASQALQECVRLLGERIDQLPTQGRPQTITVEFSLGFEASGGLNIANVVTFGGKGTTGLKVTAVWSHPDPAPRVSTHSS